MKTIILAIFICISLSSFCQENKDSLNRTQCRKYNTIVNPILNGKKHHGVDAFECGSLINGTREGIWEVINNDSLLIAHRFYSNDSLIYEVQYRRNGRISSIIMIKYIESVLKDEPVKKRIFSEVIIFDRKGKIVSRLTLDSTNNVIEIDY